jgi:GT2 family glycosyltransferase
VVVARAMAAVLGDAQEAAALVTWIIVDGMPMPACRHEAVRRMRQVERETGEPFEFVLWWDDDQAPPPGTFRRYLDVLSEADARIGMVTAQTFVRRGPSDERLAAVTPLKPSSAEVQYARGAGLFYALMRRDVLEEIDVETTMRSAFGEDWEYTTAMVARGRRILFLPGIEVAHLRVKAWHDRTAGWLGCHVVEEQ